MDFEGWQERVTLEEYISAYDRIKDLRAAGRQPAQIGSILGGAGLGNQQHIYNFGRSLGLAFQVQGRLS